MTTGPNPSSGRKTTDRDARLLRFATNASVATAIILILAKLVAWVLSGSVSLLASLIDSLMDALASILNLIAVRFSLTPADAEHRFGHGKAESLAALGQATFIAGSAVFLVLHAVDRLFHPQPLVHVTAGIVVIIFATVATLILLAIQKHVISETGSTAIKADALHYTTDVLINVGILAALFLASLGWAHIDAIIGILIAVYVSLAAWRIGHEAVQMLMDRELPDSIQQQLRQIVARHPMVLGVHELRTRQSGRDYFIQMHLEFAGDMRLIEAHAIGDAVEMEIKKVFPSADVLIHHDPVGTSNSA